MMIFPNKPGKSSRHIQDAYKPPNIQPLLLAEPPSTLITSIENRNAHTMNTEDERRPEKSTLFEQGFEFVKYRDLPVPHQMAIAWYMAVNGEAWDDIIDHDQIDLPEDVENSDDPRWHSTYKAALEKLLPRFVRKYGKVEFGVATWDTESLITSIAGDDTFKEDGIDLNGTRAWFKTPMQNYFTTSYPETDRWPVIMSGFEDETLQDGWHRFHIYVANGHPDIPVIFFPEKWHRELKTNLEAAQPKR